MSITRIIAIVAVVLAFMSLYLVYFLRSRMMIMVKKLQSQGKRIEDLESELHRLRGPQLFTQQPIMGPMPESIIEPPNNLIPDDEDEDEYEEEEYEEIPDTEPQTEQPAHQEPPQEVEVPQQSYLSKRCSEFINEYNTMRNGIGTDSRLSRDEFINRFNIIGINCVNCAVRMKQPEVAPEFSEISPVPSGEYWGYEIDNNIYAVVPNVKIYTDRYHIAHAMSQAFESNFVSGKTYNIIDVLIPAIFEYKNNNWHLNNQGRLALR